MHTVTTNLTEYRCSTCGHYGVFITVEQRKAFAGCPRGRQS